MINEILDMRVEGSVGKPTLTTYLISYTDALVVKKRPLVVICPGGGYSHVSDREGEILALQFLAMGYHAAVLRYSVSPAVYPTQLLELAKAMSTIREHTKEWCIEEDKIILQGSSAGAHLAASLGCFWNQAFLAQAAGVENRMLCPNAMILSYPVITSGEFAHKDSFVKLLGDRYNELLEQMSLENQVTEDTPKTFLWHTYEDGAVPMENSLLFAQALRKKNIPLELHIYPRGGHGLGLGNILTSSMPGKEIQPEISTWIAMAGTFITLL